MQTRSQDIHSTLMHHRIVVFVVCLFICAFAFAFPVLAAEEPPLQTESLLDAPNKDDATDSP